MGDSGYMDAASHVRDRVADLIDAHQWSRSGGTVGEQIAERLAEAGLLRGAVPDTGDDTLCTAERRALAKVAAVRRYADALVAESKLTPASADEAHSDATKGELGRSLLTILGESTEGGEARG